MVAVREDASAILEAVQRLAGALETLEFGPECSDLAASRDQLTRILRSYLTPRLANPETQIRVVFAGPTGSGKSTLVNSLSGLDVSETGALRPTTSEPIILASQRSAPVLSEIAGVGCEVVFGNAPILDTMSLVDTPDIDSTEIGHRVVAETLIDNADVVVFVTSALRYADEVPWEVLRRAISRGAPVIKVLNRVSSATTGSIVDFKSRLAAAGLDDDVVTIPEHHIARGRHRVPSLAVRSLSKLLGALAVEQRDDTHQKLGLILGAVLDQTRRLTDSIEDMNDEIDSLEAELSISALERVPRLNFVGVGDELHTPTPSPPSRGAIRRWSRRNRPGPLAVKGLESRLIDRLIAVIHTDLREWLAEEEMVSHLEIEIGEVVSQALMVARVGVEGWLDFVRRIAKTMTQRDIWIAGALLIDSATRDDSLPAAAVVLGDDTEDVVERARRELNGRIDVIYGHVVTQLVGVVRHRRGQLDPGPIRVAAGAVTATLAKANA